MQKTLHVSYFAQSKISYTILLPEQTKYIQVNPKIEFLDIISKIEANYQKDSLIIIDDNKTKSNHLFGWGFQLALAIRTYNTLSENSIQHAPILIIGKFSFRQYLDRHPKHIFVVAPGIRYISFLDIEMNDLQFSDFKEISQDELSKTKDYFKNNNSIISFDRHLAASNFGMNIIGIFIKLIKASSINLAGDEASIVNFLNEVAKNRPDLELNSGIFNFEQNADSSWRNNMEAEKDRIEYLISGIQGNLNQNDVKIALIDDEAIQMRKAKGSTIGWQNAIASLIFSEPEIIYDVINDLPNTSKNYRLNVDDFELITQRIDDHKIGCILLDVHLDPDNQQSGIENKLGTLLLAFLRKKFPTLPIIIITATNKPWKHRYLLKKGADAVWVKEGIDEARSPKASYYNIIRLLQLLNRVTNMKYQFLYQLGEHIKNLKDKNNYYWWTNSPIEWPHGKIPKHQQSNENLLKAEHGNDFRKEISNCLNNIQNSLRSFLLETELHFNESTGGAKDQLDQSHKIFQQANQQSSTAKALAETIVIQIGKIIEIIHGQRWMDARSKDRINVGLIGCKYNWHNERREYSGRGDWIAYWLYQHRNECAHYFEDVEFNFSSETAEDRSLANLLTILIAYLGNKTQPFHNADESYLKDCQPTSTKSNRKVNPDFIEKYIESTVHFNGTIEFAETYQQLISILRPDGN